MGTHWDEDRHDRCTDCGQPALITYATPGAATVSYCGCCGPTLRDRPTDWYCTWCDLTAAPRTSDDRHP